MTVHVWTDQRGSKTARAVVQQGRCADGQCDQFAISISNGVMGMTVRFDSESEFRRFLERGEIDEDFSPTSTPDVARARDRGERNM